MKEDFVALTGVGDADLFEEGDGAGAGFGLADALVQGDGFGARVALQRCPILRTDDG